MDDLAAVGRRVSAARKAAGIKTRRELSARLRPTLPRMGQETIGKIERGERGLQPFEIEPFAEALGVDRDYFFGPVKHEAPSLDDRLERIQVALEDRNTRVFGILQANSQQLEQISRELLGRLDALEERMGYLSEATAELSGAVAELRSTSAARDEEPGGASSTGPQPAP